MPCRLVGKLQNPNENMKNYPIIGNSHQFEKTNLITIKGKNGVLYDEYKCIYCQHTGIRVGLNTYITAKEKVCTHKSEYTPQRIKIILRNVEALGFGFMYEDVRETVPPPKEYQHLEGVWVYSETRKEPARLLFGEFEIMPNPVVVPVFKVQQHKHKQLHKIREYYIKKMFSRSARTLFIQQN